MKIEFSHGIYYAQIRFDDVPAREYLKSLGFHFHFGDERCYHACEACKAHMEPRIWFTADKTVASRAEKYLAESAIYSLADHYRTVEASKAADSKLEVPAPPGCEYYPYQLAAVEYALARRNVLLADSCGTGKTVEALGVANAVPNMGSILVICPASLRLLWKREAEKWLVRPRLIHVVESNDPPHPRNDLVIVNYERLVGPRAAQLRAALMARTWGLLIVDEAHRMKTGTAQRSEVILGKKGKREDKKRGRPAEPAQLGLINQAKRALFLTGTPLPNRPKELWPLLHALDPVTWNLEWPFLMRYCGAVKETIRVRGGFTREVWHTDGASRLEELQERMRSTVMIRRAKSDVLPFLPKKTRQIVFLPPTGASAAVKAEHAAWTKQSGQIDVLAAEVDLAEAGGDTVAYEMALDRLCQTIADIDFKTISVERQKLALAKLPSVFEHLDLVLEERPKIVVMAHHHAVIEQLVAHYGSEAVCVYGPTPQNDRLAIVDRFQSDPKIRVFIGSIQAAGVGLTLTAADYMAFVESSWVPGDLSQAEDRIHRISQRNAVLIQHLAVDESLDAVMLAKVIRKQQIADAALEHTAAARIGPVEPPKPPKIVWPVATDEERGAASAGFLAVSALCDGARQRDGMGFSGAHAHMGRRVAEIAKRRQLTDGEVALAKRILPRYHKQLPAEILARLMGTEKQGTLAEVLREE
ncbi:MAG: DEAD/DEAH box helicase [bacterium]